MLVLRSLKGVGDSSILKLLKLASQQSINSLEGLVSHGIGNLPFKKTPPSLTEFLSTGEFEVARLSVEDDLRNWASQDISVISINDPQYPKRLLKLVDPPPFLYYKGNVNLLSNPKAIAVVGTRHNSPLGAIITERTVKQFHSYSFCVVSGLALGIDSIAHRAALDCGAPTVAVLVDLMKISPSTNKNLAEEIFQKGGLLVAENQPGTPTIGPLFAKRDRIQAGLSTSVFAIETSKDGGTMHAVRAAGKMSRPVFVPDPIAAKYGDLTAKVIEGTQFLIESKIARPYTSGSYDQISEELAEIALSFEVSGSDESEEGLLF